MYIQIYIPMPPGNGPKRRVLSTSSARFRKAVGAVIDCAEIIIYIHLKLSPGFRKNRDANSLVQQLARGDRKSLIH